MKELTAGVLALLGVALLLAGALSLTQAPVSACPVVSPWPGSLIVMGSVIVGGAIGMAVSGR